MVHFLGRGVVFASEIPPVSRKLRVRSEVNSSHWETSAGEYMYKEILIKVLFDHSWITDEDFTLEAGGQGRGSLMLLCHVT